MALIAVFYLLDIDYTRSHELGLTGQRPGELINVFMSAMEEYTKFKNSYSQYLKQNIAQE